MNYCDGFIEEQHNFNLLHVNWSNFWNTTCNLECELLAHSPQGEINNRDIIYITPYSTGVDVRRQILRNIDVKFWRLKLILALQKNPYL